mgnify:CR=1 FL=1
MDYRLISMNFEDIYEKVTLHLDAGNLSFSCM